MADKLEIKVYDREGTDVTDTRDWYIDKDGCLFFEINDIDLPLYFAEEFDYEILVNGVVVVSKDYNEKNLERFVKAQENIYEIALSEIKKGTKKTHWMWYIFPQIKGLGYSSTSQYYAIQDKKEAEEYLKHPVLGKRLKQITNQLLKLENKNADVIFGFPDNEKLKSSMTLFAYVSDDSIFRRILEEYFDGKMCEKTLKYLQ